MFKNLLKLKFGQTNIIVTQSNYIKAYNKIITPNEITRAK